MDTAPLIRDFITAANLAGARLEERDIEVEVLPAPHIPPSRLPAGRMAVYVFMHGERCLKVGKAGPSSSARYTSQHYNAGSAPSTLSASLVKYGSVLGVPDLDVNTAGTWIKANATRLNFTLEVRHGIPVLSLLEAFLQCKLRPMYEGFAGQRDA